MPDTSVPVCYRHPDRETYVRCTRCDRPICPDCMVSASVGFQCPDDAKAGAASVREGRTVAGGRVRPPLVTQVLIGLNVAVFLATALGGSSLGFGGGTSSLYARLAVQPTRLSYLEQPQLGVVDGIAQGQYWRLLTAMFLHYGLAHIVLNMLALLQLGPVVESALGRSRFLALYLLAGLTGTTASYVLGPLAIPSAGASGAIFGLFAAAYVIERKRGSGAASQYAVLLAVNLLLTFSISFIDKRGHVGGLIGGALAALVLLYAPRARRNAVQAAGLGALALLLVVAVALRTAALTQA